MDIKEIISSSIQRDELSFRSLVERYTDYAFSVAFRIINEEEESKDIVQETFISVWNNIESFRIDKNFTNWLYRIIVNKCNDSLRKKKREALIYPDSDNWKIPGMFSRSNPEEKLNNLETGSLIRHLTNNLSRKQKIVFVLSDLEELSHDDISEITGMNKTSIKSNLNHARRNIRQMLEKYYGNEK